ncbi:MAG TPA: 7TM diverse intracellular signaling domain-containing protein [Syntrophales bacterium]|nr:7TM diverse intracellular signaling domain-containing protein [Syntrophales bacterium]
MRIKQAALCAFFFLLVAIAGCAEENSAPAARAGNLDLSGWTFERDGPVELDGEWEFYWHQLLAPDDFSSGRLPARTGYFSIPAYWNGHDANGRPLSGSGCATHRLLVRLKPGQGPLALKTECMGGSYRIWANGNLVLWGGDMDGKDALRMPGDFIVMHAGLSDPGGNLEIVFQVSNEIFHTGGPSRKITLGEASRIAAERMVYWSIDVLLFGCLAIIGLYHIVFFLLRRKDRTSLYFGCICLLWSVELLIMGALRGNSFLIVFSTYPAWLAIFRLELLCWFLFTPFLLMFVSSLYPQEASQRTVRLFQAAAALFSIAALFAPERFLGRYAIFPYELISMGGAGYALYLLARAAARKRAGAVTIAAGYLILFLAAVNDFLFVNNIVYTFYSLSLGIAGMIFAQAFALSRRFSHALSASETLVKELEKNLLLQRQLLQSREREERAVVLAQKEALLKLRYQLNPHFLFNVLTSIRGAIAGKAEVAREMVTALAEFCRLTLAGGEAESLTVGEEVRQTGLYLRIEQIRQGGYLKVSWNVDPGAEDVRIPSFTLQPLVENAVKYGKQTSPEELCIEVGIRRCKDRVVLEVANKGRLAAPEADAAGRPKGIGLENLRQRLVRFYAGDFSLKVLEENGWVRAVIDAPAGKPARTAQAAESA